jgi:hypothetical protein
MLAPAVPRPIQLGGRGRLGFLDEGMQQNHPRLLVDVEQDTRRPVAGQVVRTS